MQRKDITGEKHNRLTVISHAGKNSNRDSLWNCKCDCGNSVVASTYSLRSGHTKSCGCFKKERAAELIKERSIKHGMKGTLSYVTWEGIIKRCFNVNRPNYKDYGGRGISACDKWLSFEGFFEDMGDRPSADHSIERIDNDKGYYKENCKWALPREQSRNQRPQKRSTTGIRGVCWKKQNGKYQARITTSRGRIHLGYFNSLEQARDARMTGEVIYWQE